MELSRVRSLPMYKALMLYDQEDTTGKKQENLGKLRIRNTMRMGGQEWVLGSSKLYKGTQKTPSGEKVTSGENYLDNRAGSGNKPWILFNDTVEGYNNAFKCIFAFLLNIRAPYRIIEKKDGDRLLIKNLFEVK